MTIYRLEAIGHLPGEEFTFGVHVNGPPDDVATALTTWQSALASLFDHDSGAGNTLKSHISTTVGVDDALVSQLDPFTGRQVHRAEGAAVHAGTALAGPLPHEVALVVTTRTDAGGKGAHGRFYLPPLDSGSLSAGRALGAAVTAAVNGAAAMFATLLAGGYVGVVFHRALLTWDNITRVDVGDVFDVQRRRRNKLIEARTSVIL